MWLSNHSNWPLHLAFKPSVDSQSESKAMREIIDTCNEEEKATILLGVLKKYSLGKTLRIGTWVKIFLDNSQVKTSQSRQHGPLTKDEIDQQCQWWIGKVQAEAKGDPKFANDPAQLNIQADTNGNLKYRGRVQGKLPIYLLDSSLFSMKYVEETHLVKLHRGVILTMAKIREQFWIPLHRSVKKLQKGCSRCKNFITKTYQAPIPAQLPTMCT